MADSKFYMLKKFSIAIALIAVVVVLFGLWIKWEMWEPQGLKKGTLVYWLKVPDELKNFPTWGESTAPEYGISHPDSSVGPFVARMTYTTSLPLHEVLAEVKKLQFVCKQYTRGRAVCEKIINENRSIQLSYGKRSYNQDENIEVVYLEKE